MPTRLTPGPRRCLTGVGTAVFAWILASAMVGLAADAPPATTPPAVAPPAGTTETHPATTPPVEPPVVEPVPDTQLISIKPEQVGRQISNVRVVGNRVVASETILLQATGTTRGAAVTERQLALDRKNIENMGFFASVQAQVDNDLDDPDKVVVTFIVVENRVVSSFCFEGNKSISSKDLQDLLESKVGVVMNTNIINQDVTHIQEAYDKRGMHALITDTRQDETGRVCYTVQEARISKITLSGLRKTKPSLVYKVIRTKVGDVYNAVTIRRDLNRIYDLSFFEDVSYKVADDPDTPYGLAITINLKERRTGQFTLGVGFDSRSKLSGFVSISETNFRGSGRRLYAQVEYGGQRSFDVGYGNHFIGPKNASYDVSVYNRVIFREPRTVNLLTGASTNFFYEEHRTGGRISFTQPLDLDGTRNLLFAFRDERARLFQTDNIGTTVPVKLPVSQSGGVTGVSLGFLRDKRDLRLDPSSGGREQIIVEQGLALLSGTQTFTKVDLDVRHYIPLMGPRKVGELPRVVLAGRLVAGHSVGQLPAFEQYFIGGNDTVRGYDSDEQFGDNQIYGNLELRYRLQRSFQIVGFIDAGSAYGGKFSSGDELKVITGAGFGVRLQTPVGPIRLDIGHGSQGTKTHFGIGPTF